MNAVLNEPCPCNLLMVISIVKGVLFGLLMGGCVDQQGYKADLPTD